MYVCVYMHTHTCACKLAYMCACAWQTSSEIIDKSFMLAICIICSHVAAPYKKWYFDSRVFGIKFRVKASNLLSKRKFSKTLPITYGLICTFFGIFVLYSALIWISGVCAVYKLILLLLLK